MSDVNNTLSEEDLSQVTGGAEKGGQNLTTEKKYCPRCKKDTDCLQISASRWKCTVKSCGTIFMA